MYHLYVANFWYIMNACKPCLKNVCLIVHVLYKIKLNPCNGLTNHLTCETKYIVRPKTFILFLENKITKNKITCIIFPSHLLSLWRFPAQYWVGLTFR